MFSKVFHIVYPVIAVIIISSGCNDFLQYENHLSNSGLIFYDDFEYNTVEGLSSNNWQYVKNDTLNSDIDANYLSIEVKSGDNCINIRSVKYGTCGVYLPVNDFNGIEIYIYDDLSMNDNLCFGISLIRKTSLEFGLFNRIIFGVDTNIDKGRYLIHDLYDSSQIVSSIERQEGFNRFVILSKGNILSVYINNIFMDNYAIQSNEFVGIGAIISLIQYQNNQLIIYNTNNMDFFCIDDISIW